MSEELLAEAIAAEKGLRICQAHPEVVWYDEEKCPACAMMQELSRTQYFRLAKRSAA